jgi:DHA1 family multidrug resistance protein-like MFS transporter/DHA1 family quinolone resistance protein-like MFS transporter
MEMNASSRIQSRVINISSFWGQFAISMVNLALVYHMRLTFGLSAQMVGISAAVYTSTYFISCLLLGPIVSRMRPRHSVVLSVMGMAFAIALVSWTQQVIIAFIALVLYGIAMAFLWPQIEEWLARGKEGRELNRATSSFNVSWSIGTALSPLITGLLLERNIRAPLALGIGVFIAIASLIVLATRMVPSIRAVPSEHTSMQGSTQVDASTPLRFLSWAGVLTVYASLAVTLTIFPLHAMDNLPFSESIVGVLLLIRGLATVGMFIVMGKTSIWHFNRFFVILSQLSVAVLCLWGMHISGFVTHFIFFFLFGILFAMSYSYSIFHGASGSINRSRRMLIHEVLLTIGTVLGSVVGGTLYEYLNFSTVLAACAILVLLPVGVALANSLVKRLFAHR